MGDAPPKINIAPGKGWFGDDFHFEEGLFSGAMLVSGRVSPPVIPSSVAGPEKNKMSQLGIGFA